MSTSTARSRASAGDAQPRRVSRSHDRDGFLEYVASRYGRRNPSFADVLDERWPLYDTGDRIHVEGWHRDAEAAFTIVLARGLKKFCKVCSTELGGTHKNRRYCNEACKSKAGHQRFRGKGQYNAMTPDERARIVELYQVGILSILEIGGEIGRSPSAVARALHEAGVTMRGPGRPAKAMRAA